MGGMGLTREARWICVSTSVCLELSSGCARRASMAAVSACSAPVIKRAKNVLRILIRGESEGHNVRPRYCRDILLPVHHISHGRSFHVDVGRKVPERFPVALIDG